jgi:hypothetical protein
MCKVGVDEILPGLTIIEPFRLFLSLAPMLMLTLTITLSKMLTPPPISRFHTCAHPCADTVDTKLQAHAMMQK